MSDSPLAPETQPETIHLSRPWGHMEQYALNTHASVKIVTVNAGAELSLQYHHQRAELWVMLDDGLIVELDGKSWEAKAGEEIWIRSEEHMSELQSRVDISTTEIYTLSLHDALPISPSTGGVVGHA